MLVTNNSLSQHSPNPDNHAKHINYQLCHTLGNIGFFHCLLHIVQYSLVSRYLTKVAYMSAGENDITYMPEEIGKQSFV